MEGIFPFGKIFVVGFGDFRAKFVICRHGEALAYFEGRKRFVVTLLSTVHLTELINQEDWKFVVSHGVVSIENECLAIIQGQLGGVPGDIPSVHHSCGGGPIWSVQLQLIGISMGSMVSMERRLETLGFRLEGRSGAGL